MKAENSKLSILCNSPQAISKVKGGKQYPEIEGIVKFYKNVFGTIVYAVIDGLPDKTSATKNSIYGFHIHLGNSCSGDLNDEFSNAKSHYNPNNSIHPNHAGDMPPLFGNNGMALSIFLTDRFTVDEIIGKTVIIHINPDDFTTQPSGNSGMKIACGEIVRYDDGKN